MQYVSKAFRIYNGFELKQMNQISGISGQPAEVSKYKFVDANKYAENFMLYVHVSE